LLIQFSPSTGQEEEEIPSIIINNAPNLEMHVVNEEVGLEDEEEQKTMLINELKTSTIKGSCIGNAQHNGSSSIVGIRKGS
jgi:EAL domain-containing protein (putative c-di-GMP-specific phosphodiesterase class I)